MNGSTNQRRTVTGLQRRGYMMFDLTITMTLTAILLSTVSVWIFHAMQYSQRVKQRQTHARSISNVSRQLRLDAAEASNISLDGQQLTLVFGNGIPSTVYTIEEQVVTRVRQLGELTHRDRFPFAGNAKLQWNQTDKSEAVSLEIRRQPPRPAGKNATQPPGRLDARIQLLVPAGGTR